MMHRNYCYLLLAYSYFDLNLGAVTELVERCGHMGWTGYIRFAYAEPKLKIMRAQTMYKGPKFY